MKLSEIATPKTRISASLRRERKRRHEKKLRTARPIIAFDSEGVTDTNGYHRTILLADSTGRMLKKSDVSTREAFNFLLDTPPGSLNIWFSGNYDVYMMLRDWDKPNLIKLWRGEWVSWQGYKVRFRPRHEFFLKRGKKSFHSYDVFGFFQMSFVAALDDWHVGSQEIRDRLQGMKEKRGIFDESERQEIESYCLLECELLVELVSKLREAALSAGISLARWDGAGAIATFLLQSHNIKQYQRDWEVDYTSLFHYAYFGGRFELAESGHHGRSYSYDIRSAYPSALRTVPCQCNLLIRQRKRNFELSETSLFHVKWQCNDQSPWGPFPFREKELIYYPLAGEGWYWGSEVIGALKLYPASVTLIEAVEFVPQCDHRPFDWIEPAYEKRAQWKWEGNAAQLPLKLGLNSLYGKLAQKIGYGNKKPPYQSYMWAGMVTAHTRGQLLSAISQNPDAIIWIATDGIMSKEPLRLQEGTKLGEWEVKVLEQSFGIMPGVYQTTEEGKAKWKTRGFGIKEVDFDALIAVYRADPVWGQYRYQATRFIGLGAALKLVDYSSDFRKWITHERTISFFPTRRELADVTQQTPPICYAPRQFIRDGISEPFTGRAEWESARADYDLETWIDEDQP